MNKEPAVKGGRRIMIPVFIGVIVVLIAAVGVMFWYLMTAKGKDVTALKKEPNIITSMEAADAAALLKKQQDDADRNRISIKMPSEFVFSDGTAETTLNIENKEENLFDFIVQFYVDGSDEAVLETGLVSPGSILEKGTLSVDLEPGKYSASAIFTTFENDEAVAKTGLAITIVVQS